jgi:transcriptional regulator with XRE-family HTH domain
MSEAEVQPPAEAMLLNRAYKKSGLTAGDLAVATGLSIPTVRQALTGLRYYKGQPKAMTPTDKKLALLGSALGIPPEALADLGRHRAAALISEGEYDSTVPMTDATVTIAARALLARQILAVFSVDELRAEVARRDRIEEAGPDQADLETASATWVAGDGHKPTQSPTESETTTS